MARELKQYRERYPVPAIGTPSEAIRAALKAHRNPEVLQLTSRHETATGRALPDSTCFKMDCWRLVATLPVDEQRAVRLYFMTPRDDVGGESGTARYGNQEVAIEMGMLHPSASDREKDYAARRVAWLKRRAVERIEATLFPEYARANRCGHARQKQESA